MKMRVIILDPAKEAARLGWIRLTNLLTHL